MKNIILKDIKSDLIEFLKKNIKDFNKKDYSIIIDRKIDYIKVRTKINNVEEINTLLHFSKNSNFHNFVTVSKHS